MSTKDTLMESTTSCTLRKMPDGTNYSIPPHFLWLNNCIFNVQHLCCINISQDKAEVH